MKYRAVLVLANAVTGSVLGAIWIGLGRSAIEAVKEAVTVGAVSGLVGRPGPWKTLVVDAAAASFSGGVAAYFLYRVIQVCLQ